jgi:hypothetical protein
MLRKLTIFSVKFGLPEGVKGHTEAWSLGTAEPSLAVVLVRCCQCFVINTV